MLTHVANCPACQGTHDRVAVEQTTDGSLTGVCPATACDFTLPATISLGVVEETAHGDPPVFFTAVDPDNDRADPDGPAHV